MTKTTQNKTHKQTSNSSDTESQVTICQVGHVFCSEEVYDYTSLNQKNSDRQIFQMINELNDEVKIDQKAKTKGKRIKKVQIASWSKNDINKFKQLLKLYGTDFQTIGIQLGKTRDQVKRKFKVLQKKSQDVMDCVFQSDKSRSHSQSKQSVEIDFQ